jgi:TonB family protein
MRKALLTIIAILGASSVLVAQSGRRKDPVPVSTPTPEEKPIGTNPKSADPKAPPVTAEKNEEYRCTEDGTLAHIIDEGVKRGFQPKDVDTQAEVTFRPEAKYTEQARKMGVQGVVVLKLLLMPDGKIDRVFVVRPLPFGLTESAIRAACAVKFKPAIKEGEKVDQWFTIEYGFSLTKSSIYGP